MQSSGSVPLLVSHRVSKGQRLPGEKQQLLLGQENRQTLLFTVKTQVQESRDMATRSGAEAWWLPAVTHKMTLAMESIGPGPHGTSCP